MVLSLEVMPLEPKAPEPAPAKTMVVRYGYLKLIGEFPSDLTTKVGCGSKLVLRTLRGTEIGEMLTTVCGNGGCNKSITRDKMLEYIKNSGGRNFPFSESGRVLRVATTQDLAVQQRLDESRAEYLSKARELVIRHKLAMKIVEVEQLLGQERVIFYFTSEHRVDFRSLVRDFAHEFHARIELNQVGARDEARLVADYEKCGQHCCCKQFLKVLTPISMRSAKIQKATLDPAKISGRCGRLMCCLRYEDQTYEDLRKRLPTRNSRVRTEKGEAWVLDGQILTQLVMLQFDDGQRAAVPMEDIQASNLPKPKLPNGRTMQTPFDTVTEEPGKPGDAKGGPGVAAPRGPDGPNVSNKPGQAERRHQAPGALQRRGPAGQPGQPALPRTNNPPRPPGQMRPPIQPRQPGQPTNLGPQPLQQPNPGPDRETPRPPLEAHPQAGPVDGPPTNVAESPEQKNPADSPPPSGPNHGT